MKSTNKKDHLQAVISRFVTKRDEAIAQINLLLDGEYSNVVDIIGSLTKHFEQLARAEKCIETVQRVYAVEQNKKVLEANTPQIHKAPSSKNKKDK